MDKVLYSSNKTDWETPQDLFDKLNSIFHFNLDVCASKENAKCEKFYTEEEDALSREMIWLGTCWMNPPYGRCISEWMENALHCSVEYKSTVVCLVPARTDTKWWHDYVAKGEIFYLKGRLKFVGARNSAPFPSAIIVFRPKISDVLEGYSK